MGSPPARVGGHDPLTNILRALCGEPLCLTPDQVGRLTPFQVRHIYFVKRTKDGGPELDPPFYADDDESGPGELDLETEWRRFYVRSGHTDPARVARLVRRAMAGHTAEMARVTAAVEASDLGMGD